MRVIARYSKTVNVYLWRRLFRIMTKDLKYLKYLIFSAYY